MKIRISIAAFAYSFFVLLGSNLAAHSDNRRPFKTFGHIHMANTQPKEIVLNQAPTPVRSLYLNNIVLPNNNQELINSIKSLKDEINIKILYDLDTIAFSLASARYIRRDIMFFDFLKYVFDSFVFILSSFMQIADPINILQFFNGLSNPRDLLSFYLSIDSITAVRLKV